MTHTQITIVMDEGVFDVVDEAGRCCDGLSWDEMLGQVAMLTMPACRLGKGFRMQTPEEWANERSALHARLDKISTKENDK